MFKAPVGYSFFPEDSIEAQRRASWFPLSLPQDGDCESAVEFVRRARALQEAGFMIGAVNATTAQAVNYAASAILSQPRTVPHHDAEVALSRIETDTRNGVEAVTATTYRVLGRQRSGKGWRFERRFRFERIMGELEAFDVDGTPSDFMSRIRL